MAIYSKIIHVKHNDHMRIQMQNRVISQGKEETLGPLEAARESFRDL